MIGLGSTVMCVGDLPSNEIGRSFFQISELLSLFSKDTMLIVRRSVIFVINSMQQIRYIRVLIENKESSIFSDETLPPPFPKHLQ